MHRGGLPQSGPAFRRGPRGLPGGPSERRLTRGRARHTETERPLRLKMFAQDLFRFLSSTHEHGYTPRCPSKHMSETAMALCIAPSIPNITARHLVPWHLIQTRRHCRYLEQKLSTPRVVKWEHIVRQMASSQLYSCDWMGRMANTHDGECKIGGDIQISI